MHFGIITPPVSGHLHPFGALGRELIDRGHRVTVFHMPDLRERVEKERLEFVPVGEADFPLGSLAEDLAELTRLDGLAALRFTIQAIRRTTEMLCHEAPAAIGKAGVEVLLVDQTEPAGGSIAEFLGVRFVTVCNALLMNREPDVPPPFTSWGYDGKTSTRLMNRIGYATSGFIMGSITNAVAKYRKRWGLPPHHSPEDSFSSLLQISQQPRSFDFPRTALPACFHYVGPLRRTSDREIPFPWDKLDGRPLIYASLGTLQNGKQQVFQRFAEACLGLDVQLVITHGGGLSADAASSFPGDPLVVPYAPQLDVLTAASLTLTHAGLNTVLDSLTHGVPLVAVPITYEQPAIAQRVSWTGAGRVLKFTKLNSGSLRGMIGGVLKNPEYKNKARTIQQSIAEAGGVKRAADLIQQALTV
jgi:MGT family glycosyltransferase